MRCLVVCLAVCLLLIFETEAQQKAPGLHLFVSTGGNDQWSGRLAEPNGDKTDGPFASVQRARDEIRDMKSSRGLPTGGVTVVVRGGWYFFEKPFELTAEDSGTADAPVVYAAFPGEEVRWVGGKVVSGFAPVKDGEILKRFEEEARPNVLQADLRTQGITDYGEASKGIELFFQDTPMTLSRWPNKGFAKIGELVVNDGHEIHGIKGSKVGQFKYEGDRPARWADEKDPWAHGYWFWDWSDQRQKIASIDLANATIRLAEPYHGYGYRKGQWYYAFNLLSEIDTPGEWYLDRDKGILYFWPPENIGNGKAVVSIAANVICLQDVSHVSFQGLDIEACRETAITIKGGIGNRVSDCVIRNVGEWGVVATGELHVVEGCDIYLAGKGGVRLEGGDRSTLTPGHLAARDNQIHRYGRIDPTYSPGVSLSGVGNEAVHNVIHTAPHAAILFSGNEHVMEFNEIYNVCEESNDAGAIYTGRNWTMRGNKIRYNYLHHINGFEQRGCMGVYLDDMFSSADIIGNVFYKVTRAVLLGGGRDCRVENNIFVDCEPALNIDARAMNWAGYHADDWIKEANEKETILGIAFKKPPYSERYPQLPHILEDEPKAPKGNVIARNICWGGKWDHIEDIAKPYLAMENNLVGEDPRFVDAEHQDFRLREDSPALAKGFQPIPIDKIGRFKAGSESRANPVPVAQAVLDRPEVQTRAKLCGWMAVARYFREHGDIDNAIDALSRIAKLVGLSASEQAAARMEAGHTYAEAGRGNEARSAYSGLAEDRAAPQVYRTIARLCLGRSHAEAKEYDQAVAAYNKILEDGEVPPHQQWEARERLAETERLRQGLPARDPSRSRLKLPESGPPAIQFYIAPDGSDQNPGTIESPFATFGKAQEVVAAIKKQGPLPKGGVAINLRQGTYTLNAGLNLGKDLSGTADAPVVFRAHEEESVVLDGGKAVTHFRVVEDPAVLERLPEEARGRVWEADLKAQGVTHYGTRQMRGYSCEPSPVLEVFFDGTPLTPARWPNDGFVRTGKVLKAGSKKDGTGAVFVYEGDRPSRWRKAIDIWLYGYWFHDWADNAIEVTSLDTEKRQIRTGHTSSYGIKAGQRYYAFNLLEEIDTPGEYYVDREAGILYLYPATDPNQASITLSMIEDPMITITDASYVTLQGLTLDTGRLDGIHINGSSHCLVAGCTLRRFAGTGIKVSGGEANGVLSSDLHTLGCGGIRVLGGDRRTLTAANHFVENCHIYDFSRIDRTYTPAVYLDGVGSRIAHNLFNDTPCHAMRIEGNDHLVEFNEFHDVVRESDDQGAIDMWYNFSYRGNVIRYNYFHDIGNDTGCGQAGVRLDDAISGTVIYGNVFRRCSRAQFGAVQIHGGKDNWVDNNLIVDCRYGVSFSRWGEKRWSEFLESGTTRDLVYAKADIDKPPYTVRYPELTQLRERIDTNRIWRNVAVDCGSLLTRDNGIQDLADNQVLGENPGFLDRESGDFRLRPDAGLLRLSGFQVIPFGEIGLYEDGYRLALEKRRK